MIQGPPSSNMTYPLNMEGRAILRRHIFEAGNCYATAISSSKHWDAWEASPLCNCLDNMLVEFALSHVGLDHTRIPELDLINRGELQRMMSTVQKNEVARAISDTCFSGARSTQVPYPLPDFQTFFSRYLQVSASAVNFFGSLGR